MTTPYRSDVEALREKKAVLEREIADLARLRGRHDELTRELASVDEQIRAKETQRLPSLDDVRVASPCGASWDDMVGDDRVRFCKKCEKHVFNLSAMTREDAEGLLRERAGGDVCIRFYRRADGTVMTSDCPVGVTKKRRRLVVLAAAGAGAMALAAVAAAGRHRCIPTGTQLQGRMAAPAPPQPAPSAAGVTDE